MLLYWEIDGAKVDLRLGFKLNLGIGWVWKSKREIKWQMCLYPFYYSCGIYSGFIRILPLILIFLWRIAQSGCFYYCLPLQLQFAVIVSCKQLLGQRRIVSLLGIDSGATRKLTNLLVLNTRSTQFERCVDFTKASQM